MVINIKIKDDGVVRVYSRGIDCSYVAYSQGTFCTLAAAIDAEISGTRYYR